MNKNYDVAIVGAAMAGATTAALLADTSLSVLVLDRGEQVQPPHSYGARVSALGRAADRVLDAAGVWAPIQAMRVSAYRRMVVWDAQSSGRLEFDAARLASPYLGHIVENDVVTAFLHRRINAAANIEVRFNTALEALDVFDDRVELRPDDGPILNATIVVGADGAGSWVRNVLGLEQTRTDYQQRGIVCQVCTERDHEHTAWQRFMASGPLAFLPLANGECSIVWSCDEPLAGELLSLDDQSFTVRLQNASDNALGAILQVGPRYGFPLRRAHAGRYSTRRAVLIGDAAHIVHPLAGQGANLGIADAATLAQVLVEAHGCGRDIGQDRTLRRYERWRKGENLAMLSLVDALQRLFSQNNRLVCTLRGAGLNMTNQMGWLKDELAARAMGEHGDLSLPARGVPLSEST